MRRTCLYAAMTIRLRQGFVATQRMQQNADTKCAVFKPPGATIALNWTFYEAIKVMAEHKRTRFVVQEHHARQLHYDLRLEMEGVLKSWALPKGPSMNPADKRLAILVEDHPLDYYDFEGIIPAGHPGAGPVLLWDQGEYRVSERRNPMEAFLNGKMVIELFGNTLKGRFTLLKMRGRGEKNWLLIKGRDGHSQPNWALQKAMTKERKSRLEERIPPCEAA